MQPTVGKVLLLALALLTGAEARCQYITIDNEWTYNYGATFSAPAPTDINGLILDLYFNRPADTIDFWQGTVTQHDPQYFTLEDDAITATEGSLVEFEFQVHFSGAQPVIMTAAMNGVPICDESPTTVPPLLNPCEETGMTPYDYAQVLCMSYLFYEAERSGPLPLDQRVTWRYDSALEDGSDVGEDLVGGYYDAGDHVKFGFPMAFTTTMLGWGLVDFQEGHETAGQLEYGQAAVKWATDYFLKAHTGYREFYGQVGKGDLDHVYWGRPENMTMERPSYKIDQTAPGSELAGETAAALTVASIAFQSVDPAYASEMLGVAEELYLFADENREEYSNSIEDAAGYYRSWSGYIDELFWSAEWLYRATGNETYRDRARFHYSELDTSPPNDVIKQFSWDDKRAGALALGMVFDPEFTQYQTGLQEYFTWLHNDATYTPDGLVYLDTWGANRHAANVAFLHYYAAKNGMDVDANRQWADGQMNLTLGDSGRSFVVGYGENPPERPHHRSSSCPSVPGSCTDGWALNQEGANPQVLYGALVGGPDQDGNYVDDRGDYIHNEVACDYNAAFTGALAAMVELN